MEIATPFAIKVGGHNGDVSVFTPNLRDHRTDMPYRVYANNSAFDDRDLIGPRAGQEFLAHFSPLVFTLPLILRNQLLPLPKLFAVGKARNGTEGVNR